jgi:O-antigen/teichoic acid export membrane protein
MTQFMALASLPMFFGLGAVADVFVPLILGAKWAASIIVIQLLGFVKLPGTVNYFFGSAMIAVGKPRIVLRQSIVMLVITPILLYIGAMYGLVGIMVALIARSVIATAYNVHALNREINLGALPLLRVLMPPVIACAAMVGAVELAKFELGGVLSGFTLLAALVAIGAATYGAVLLLGDLVHLWRGYIRGAFDSLGGAMVRRRPRVATTPA